jgi:hypothetical protein
MQAMMLTLLVLLAAYCGLMGIVGLLVCTMNGTPPFLVASLVQLVVAIVATVVAVRISRKPAK